ncbi:ATP-dependent DNA helicase RecG [Paenibacillus thermotolerans]|uniref:ATP-dependent DNA helicase RecG n=1 Tax=Paenibacillus thermotolerans TaxID=3027807 RepID=UPI00236745FD|nr:MULTISPECIES: ATP-dependent DNA helicase RecG [unclassified Paenibacillus]
MRDVFQIPVDQVRGVGDAKARELASFGIVSVGGLFEFFPHRYEDFRIRELSEAGDGERVTVSAVLMGVPSLQMYGRKKSRLVCRAASGAVSFTAVWFNQHYLKDKLASGSEVVLTGKWDRARKQLTVSTCEFPNAGTQRAGTVQPVYALGGELSQAWFRKVMATALQQYGDLIPEWLPEELVRKYRLVARSAAIAAIHQPSGQHDGVQARRRLVYEELFLFQLKLQAYRAMTRRKKDGVAHSFDREEVRRFVRSLPFELTDSQKHVVADILRDLEEPYAMNRLLQGDVGAGKTVVAAVALYACVKAGRQGALMVPTEILAEQHARSLSRLFDGLGVEVGLLIGSMTERQRRDVLAGLQSGMTDIVVGTHALIQEGVYFNALGLVVTDEQHRFGVQQRAILRRKGMNPDVLTMTATPIPRTLAITAFGDMDVSTLNELPKGRLPIKTYWVKHSAMDRVLGMIGKELAAGRQAYVICPLIEESDKLDFENALDMCVRLQGVFGAEQVDLLHGRMTAADKEAVMGRFKDGAFGVLVSTTVVEVGVDVPNATVMVVYDAERFGLSQLHQLRGRVGRGEHQSYCVLVADPKSEQGRERMRVMTETNDGFEVARRDLELRGPGDFFGTKQSGAPEFRLADLSADFAVLEAARDDAAALVQGGEFWTNVKYTALRSLLLKEQMFQGEQLD